MSGIFSLLLLLVLLSWANELLPDEKKTIGTYVPDVSLEDSDGRVFSIKGLNKVVVLNPIYTRCTSACPLMTQGLKKAIKDLREDLLVLSLTFDPKDGLEDLRRFREVHNLPENWYVVRSKEAEKLLRAIDYRYRYDEKLGEFDHPNLYVVLTPSGRVSRYLYGVNPKLRDLELAVLEAKREEVRLSPIEGFWLRCFRYNPERGTYEVDWFFVLNVAGGMFTFTLVPALVWGKGIYKFFRTIPYFLVKNS